MEIGYIKLDFLTSLLGLVRGKLVTIELNIKDFLSRLESLKKNFLKVKKKLKNIVMKIYNLLMLLNNQLLKLMNIHILVTIYNLKKLL